MDSDQTFTLYPLGGGLTAPPNPQRLNCNNHTEPSNFRGGDNFIREVGGLKKSGMREADPL